MIHRIDIVEFLTLAQHLRIIEVRSPSEYVCGHIPGAVNIPLYSDEERVLVGITYMQAGRENAMGKGLEIVGPKLVRFVEEAQRIAPERKVLLHCWRGGMRSEGFGWLLHTAGFEVWILNGGYKSYRRYILECFARPRRIIILGGMTGSGKSEIIRHLEQAGHQVIDLEKIACHKGSAFGHIGQNQQPTTEQFQNNLSAKWMELDPEKPVWIEDESQAIGVVHIPESLYRQMRSAPVIKVELDRQKRAVRLVREYDSGKVELNRAILKISDKLGGAAVKRALCSLETGNYLEAANIILNYYDKAYSFGLSKRDPGSVFTVHCPTDEPNENAELAVKAVEDFLVSSN